MEIPRNGFKTSKSLSPVMMRLDLAVTANSRNLFSFGSRHSVMEIVGLNVLLLLSNFSIIHRRSLSFRKYLSNFLRKIMAMSSFDVSLEIHNTPISKAFSNVFRDIEFFKSVALISVLVSNTNRLLVITQNILKNISRESPFFHLRSNLIQKLFEFFRRIAHEFFSQNHIGYLRDSIFLLLGGQTPFFCSIRRYFNNNTFHSQIIYP